MPRTTFGGWLPPALPAGFAGPDDVAAVLNDYAQFTRENLARDAELATVMSPPSTTPEGLTALVRLAYQLSLSPEEGRFPRARLLVPANTFGSMHRQPHVVARFLAPMSVTGPGILRKLAPAASQREFAWLVREVSPGAFECDGIISLAPGVVFPSPAFQPRLSGFGHPPGLMVRVDGPGELRATEHGVSVALRGGTILVRAPWQRISVVQRWLREEVFVGGGLGTEEGAPLAEEVLQAVFTSVIEYRHGGAFVVTATDATESVSMKYRLAPIDLRLAIEGFWGESMKALSIDDVDAVGNTVDGWRQSAARLLASAQAVAALANVDGAVVIDRSLRVTAFGAVITAPPASIPCVRSAVESLEATEVVDITQYGTRHQSAYRLCASQPGTLVFVISQDGDMRVFFGDRKRVHLWDTSAAFQPQDEW